MKDDLFPSLNRLPRESRKEVQENIQLMTFIFLLAKQRDCNNWLKITLAPSKKKKYFVAYLKKKYKKKKKKDSANTKATENVVNTFLTFSFQEASVRIRRPG